MEIPVPANIPDNLMVKSSIAYVYSTREILGTPFINLHLMAKDA